jgi:hypothetical protein
MASVILNDDILNDDIRTDGFRRKVVGSILARLISSLIVALNMQTTLGNPLFRVIAIEETVCIRCRFGNASAGNGGFRCFSMITLPANHREFSFPFGVNPLAFFSIDACITAAVAPE